MSPEIAEYFASDEAFDSLYPIYVRELSEIHWTPLQVAEVAAAHLGPDDSARVIDIGAGAGKFCIAGSVYSQGTFVGIEQRKNFVTVGNKVIKQLGLQRASLIYGNFTELDLRAYTGIYFYNSFHENLVHSDALDNKLEVSGDLYDLYTAHLLDQLERMPIGTRLATYWLSITEIPGCYRLVSSHFNDLLKLWVKEV